MPQILMLFVSFASLMQRYEFFLIYARKSAFIFQKNASYKVITYSLWTFRFSICQNLYYRIYIYYNIYKFNIINNRKSTKLNVQSE